MDQVLEWVKVVLTFASPIAVLLVSANIERRQKKEADAKAERQKADDKRDEENKKLIADLTANIQEIKDRLESVDGSIQALQGYDKTVKEDMHSFSQSQQISAQYVHELAELVMTLAEGMRDQHLDGNITRAIASLRAFEHDTLTKLTKQMAKTSSHNDDD